MNDDGLQHHIATKTAPAETMWKIHVMPDKATGYTGVRFPVDLMREAQVGDELWWYSASEEAWKNLCGCDGWALVRNGEVIARTIYTMN